MADAADVADVVDAADVVPFGHGPLWHCPGPRARLRVALWLALAQSDRAPNPQFFWFQTEFRRFARPHGMASNSHFSEFGARFLILQKSSSLPVTDMQDAKNNALQNREFGKRFRTTSGNPKLRQLRVRSPICSNLFMCGHGPELTMYCV